MAMFLPVPEIFAAPASRAHEPGAETSAVCAQAAHLRSLLDELDVLAPPSTRPQAGFVNACLRRFLREREPLLAAVADEPEARWNHPDWWISQLRRDHPRQNWSDKG